MADTNKFTVTIQGKGSFGHLQIHDENGYVCTVPTPRFEEVLAPELAARVKADIERQAREKKA